MRAIVPLLFLLAPAVQADTLVAVDRDHGRVHVVDVDTFTPRGTIEVGHHPHEVLATSATRAWVALYGDGSQPGHELVEIDLAAAKVLRRVDTLPLMRPHGLVRAGDNVYFTAEANRAVGRLNPAEGRIDRVLGLGRDVTHMIDIAPDGQQLFTADMLSGTVTRIDFRAGKPLPELASFAVGDKPEGLAVHPDGKQAWVGLNGEGTIKVLDLATGTVAATLAAGSQPARLRFTPDGRYALSIDPQASKLLVFDVAARKLAFEHVIEGVPLGMAPSADGKRVFVTLAAAGGVGEVEIATGRLLRRADLGSVSDGIGLARD